MSAPVLVRSWNLYHGNTVPLSRRNFLERMVRLAAEDRPEVLCLQELPAWALPCLEGWSGMRAVADLAQRPMLGPLPSSAELGRRLTELNPGLLRSAFSGQGNGLLTTLEVLGRWRTVLNSWDVRRRTRADIVTKLAWGKERRICQAVRVVFGDGRTALVANLHATSCRDMRLPDAELLRAAVFVDALAEPDELLVLAGDFNVTPVRSRTLAELAAWGFSGPGPWIDHILVRGDSPGPLDVWPVERRRVAGRVLSDHAPVELTIE